MTSDTVAAALGGGLLGALIGGGLMAFMARRLYFPAMQTEKKQTQKKRASRPKRLIFIRHGESLGNVDASKYATISDNKMPLTDAGHAQAEAAGKKLKAMLGDESVRWFVSPYHRTVQTFQGLVGAFGFDETNPPPGLRMVPQIREQDFGNFQKPEEMAQHMQDRKRFGRFWYRFPYGESGADVFDRVDGFISNLSRLMDGQYEGGPATYYDNYVFVTHGLTMRLLCMRYLRWSIEQFEDVWNPDNCECWVMQKTPEHSYELVTKVRYGDLQELKEGEEARPLPHNMRTTELPTYLRANVRALNGRSNTDAAAAGLNFQSSL